MHNVNDLVLSCIDFRFRPNIASWIEEHLDGKADLVALAGASKSLFDESSQKIVLNQIRIAKELHGISTVHIMDHIDCGAYGGSKDFNQKDDEIAMHNEKLKEAAQIIRDHFPDLRIELYIMDFGVVSKLAH